MSIYTLTRGKLILRYTPTFEGKYLAEASVDGGTTYTSSQLCEKEQVERVVSYAHTTSDTVVQENGNV